MFNVSIDVDNLDSLRKVLVYVNKLKNMKVDKVFQKYIQNKCLQVAKIVTESRLTGGTTNDEYIQQYKKNHKIQETNDGFILYNDTTIPVSELEISDKTALNYPNGFCIALAFEYGVGIVGENNAKVGAWNYNINNYTFAWHFIKDGELQSTYGYEGFEIYRYTKEEIEKNMYKWITEYAKGNGGVST